MLSVKRKGWTLSRQRAFLVIFLAVSFLILYKAESYLGPLIKNRKNIPKNEIYFGVASWYGPGFYGKRMANNKKYKPYLSHVAHKSLPLGTIVLITNLENGKQIIVPVFDRGPYIKNRDFDLSVKAAEDIGATHKGVIPISYEVIMRPT